MKRSMRITHALLLAGLVPAILSPAAHAQQVGPGPGHEQQPQAPAETQYEGEITRLRSIDVKGEKADHAVALVKAASGEKLWVDLGPKDQLGGLDLKKGDRIRVTGYTTRIRGYRVLITRELQAKDRTIEIRRKTLPGLGKAEQKPGADDINFRRIEEDTDEPAEKP